MSRDELIEFDKKDLAGLSCLYSNISVYIAANFDVYPCCYTRIDKKYVIGNVDKQSFNSFWLNSDRKKNPEKIIVGKCPSCPHVTANLEIRDLLTENNKMKIEPKELSADFI